MYREYRCKLGILMSSFQVEFSHSLSLFAVSGELYRKCSWPVVDCCWCFVEQWLNWEETKIAVNNKINLNFGNTFEFSVCSSDYVVHKNIIPTAAYSDLGMEDFGAQTLQVDASNLFTRVRYIPIKLTQKIRPNEHSDYYYYILPAQRA